MKKFLLLSVALIMFIGFSSCNKEKRQIIGTWIKYENNDTITLTYKKGESITVSSASYNTSGTYWFESVDTQEAAKMYITTDDCSSVAIYHPLFEGNGLYMRIDVDTLLIRREKISGQFYKN
jgi:hypothetical protein